LLKQFTFLLKNRKKQIILGVSSALLISSFILQFYIQVLVAGPAIGQYLQYILADDPSNIEISGIYNFNEEINTPFLTDIKNNYLNNEEKIAREVNESISSIDIWATKQNIRKTYFKHKGVNFSLNMINIFSQQEFTSIRDLASQSYDQKYSNGSASDFESLDGILFVYDLGYNISEYSDGKVSYLNLTLDSGFLIHNNVTTSTRNISIMIFPTSSIETSLWRNSENIQIYTQLNQTYSLSRSFSCLCISETTLQNLSLGPFFYGNEGETNLPLNTVIKLSFVTEKVIDQYVTMTSFSTQLRSSIKLMEQILKDQNCINLKVFDSTKGIKEVLNQYQLIFLIIQVVIQFPTLIFVIFSFKLFNSEKNLNFKAGFLDKLLLKGYSRMWILAYALIEFSVILAAVFFLTSILSIVIVSIPLMFIDWTEFWTNKIGILSQIFFQVLLNVESKIILTIILFIGDFYIWKSILVSVPSLKSSEKNLLNNRSVISNRTKKRVIQISILIFLMTIAGITTLALENNGGYEYNAISLFGIIILQVISVLTLIVLIFVNGGVNLAQKLCASLANTHHIFGGVGYFLNSRKNQKLLITAILFASVAIISLSTTYHTILLNGQRNADCMQGTDVRIISGSPVNRSYVTNLKETVSEINEITVVNRTVSNLGTKYSPVNSNNYSLIIIDPNSFFDLAYTENEFFMKLSTNEIKTQLNENNSILVCSYDKEKIADIIQEDNLTVTGYYNESRLHQYQWQWKIIDYFAFWPTQTPIELKDEAVQLIMGPTTFKTITQQINLTIQAEYWIELKEQYKPQIQSIEFPNPVEMENTIHKRVETDETHPFSILLDQLFNHSLYTTTAFVILMIIQSYIIMLFYDFSTRKHDIGIFRSMGVSAKESVIGLVISFLILNIIVIIPLVASVMTIIPIIRMIIVFAIAVPIIIQINVSLLSLLIGILISTSLIPLIFFIPIVRNPIATLIKHYE